MEETRRVIRIHEKDNVAVALCLLKKGASLSLPDGSLLTVKDDIPPGHKIALKDIEAGARVVKYGFPIGAASVRIVEGAHVHTHNVQTLLSEAAEYHYRAAEKREGGYPGDIPEISVFRRKDGRIGIRNEIWIIPTVGCVNKTAEMLAQWADREYGGSAVDGVYAWTHPYGCSQMGGD
ncbi:MAG: altronate dehydratase family protein, partial [Spirochaetaceae bacterium]|nr:altronate dehydratase family protein [Spirochaetaceae bacterium]